MAQAWLFPSTADDGTPLFCETCGGTDFTEKVVDVINGTACEVDYLCSNCHTQVAFWAYGGFML